MRRYKKPDSYKHKLRRAKREFGAAFKALLKSRNRKYPKPKFPDGGVMFGEDREEIVLPNNESILCKKTPLPPTPFHIPINTYEKDMGSGVTLSVSEYSMKIP